MILLDNIEGMPDGTELVVPKEDEVMNVMRGNLEAWLNNKLEVYINNKKICEIEGKKDEVVSKYGTMDKKSR